MDQIIYQLNNSHKIFITTHINPDGDAIGSLIATGLLLDSMQKKVWLYNESPIPAVYRFLPAVDRIKNFYEDGCPYDTAIVLDCGDKGRIGDAVSMVEKIPVVINIDHHITNDRFGDLQLVDPSACATAEIIWKLIQQMGVTIDQAMATCIYTGVLTDTGSFRFSNTNEAAFTIGKEMTACGVSPFNVAQHVYGTYSLGRIKLLNLALDSIEIDFSGKLSMMTVTRDMLAETGTESADVDGFINYARSIEDVRIAALIQEENENGHHASKHRQQLHVSLRSDGSVNVAEIAKAFGGGGHFTAAGFEVESTLSDIKKDLKRIAGEM